MSLIISRFLLKYGILETPEPDRKFPVFVVDTFRKQRWAKKKKEGWPSMDGWWNSARQKTGGLQASQTGQECVYNKLETETVLKPIITLSLHIQPSLWIFHKNCVYYQGLQMP